jgi:hypothetical protein
LAVLVALASVPSISGDEQQQPRTWPEVLEEHYGPPAYKTVDPDKPLYEQTRIVSIAGRRFNVPLIYVDAALDPGEEQDGLLLIYVLPSYKSRADFANRQEYEQARQAGHFGHMLIEPEAVRPSFEEMVANRRHRIPKIVTAGVFEGLEVERWYRPDGGKLEHVSDVYIERDSSGRIVSWIDCSTEDSAVVPHCSHRFRDKALLYKVDYNKANYLQTWKVQRASAVQYINSFEIDAQAPSSEASLKAWPNILQHDLGARTYNKLDFSRPLEQQAAVVEIGNRTFNIPIVYSQTDIEADRKPYALSLNYVLPDYTSRADFPGVAAYEQAREDQRFGNMLIRPAEGEPSLGESMENRRAYLSYESAGRFEGLEHEKWYRLRDEEPILHSEVYVARDERGEITDLIICSPMSHSFVPSPDCAHKFRDGSLMYSITYNQARYLRNWRRQRSAAIAFSDELEVQPSSVLTEAR